MDREFLNESFIRAGINFKFNHRVIDTHSVAYAEHLRRDKIIPHKYEKPTESALNLDKILQSVGIPEEPRPHNALTGAKVSAEAFYRLVYEKKLLPEFEEYNIPNEIIC
jgi:DNA polymerase III epsilon subunit-like protein